MAQLQAGEVIFVPSGHAVSAHSVSFYAPDSEQAGMLARAQEIENLDKQLKAQVLLAEQARADLVRAEAAYSEASQRLVSARREGAETRARAHELQVEALRLTQLAEQTRARSEQIARATWPKWTSSWRRCRSGASRPKPALKSWTCSWPTARSATPSSTTR